MNRKATTTPAQTEDAVLQLEHDMVEIVRAELGMREREAFTLAQAIVRGLRNRYGGERLGHRGLYIPAPSKAQRNDAICKEFNGTNIEDVMKRHGIKRAQIYRIVSERADGRQIGRAGAKSPISSHEMRQEGE